MTATQLEIDDETHRELKVLAERVGRPIAELASTALREYVQYEKVVHESVLRGIADCKSGRLHNKDQVMSMLAERRKTRANG